jgi:hypothetical protein
VLSWTTGNGRIENRRQQLGEPVEVKDGGGQRRLESLAQLADRSIDAQVADSRAGVVPNLLLRVYAALDFLHRCQTLRQPVMVITRLRLDAALYEPAPLLHPTGESSGCLASGVP